MHISVYGSQTTLDEIMLMRHKQPKQKRDAGRKWDDRMIRDGFVI